MKTTQNALMGVVAVALTAYFALKIERKPGATRPGASELGRRFPKFVLGFIAASVIATIYLTNVGTDAGKPAIDVINDLREWFLILAFVSIGLKFSLTSLKEAAGARSASSPQPQAST